VGNNSDISMGTGRDIMGKGLGRLKRMLFFVLCVLCLFVSVCVANAADMDAGATTAADAAEATTAATTTTGEGETDGTAIVSADEAKKFTIRKLKGLLAERGLKCKGCAEKDDFVKMFVENQHLEMVSGKKKEEEPQSQTPPPEQPEIDKKEMDEVMWFMRFLWNRVRRCRKNLSFGFL
jgi:hypothetical protein